MTDIDNKNGKPNNDEKKPSSYFVSLNYNNYGSSKESYRDASGANHLDIPSNYTGKAGGSSYGIRIEDDRLMSYKNSYKGQQRAGFILEGERSNINFNAVSEYHRDANGKFNSDFSHSFDVTQTSVRGGFNLHLGLISLAATVGPQWRNLNEKSHDLVNNETTINNGQKFSGVSTRFDLFFPITDLVPSLRDMPVAAFMKFHNSYDKAAGVKDNSYSSNSSQIGAVISFRLPTGHQGDEASIFIGNNITHFSSNYQSGNEFTSGQKGLVIEARTSIAIPELSFKKHSKEPQIPEKDIDIKTPRYAGVRYEQEVLQKTAHHKEPPLSTSEQKLVNEITLRAKEIAGITLNSQGSNSAQLEGFNLSNSQVSNTTKGKIEELSNQAIEAMKLPGTHSLNGKNNPELMSTLKELSKEYQNFLKENKQSLSNEAKNLADDSPQEIISKSLKKDTTPAR